MAFGMYAASVPAYQRQLTAISKVLDKAQAWAAAKKVDEAVLLATRMTPDMLPFSRQVQIACRFVEESVARLAGAEVPKAPENAEKNLTELKARIAAVLAYIGGFKADQMDTKAEITLEKQGDGFAITKSHLTLKAKIPGIDAAKFQGTFKKVPDRDEFAADVNESLIVELYSR